MQSESIAKLVTALVKVQGALRGYKEDSTNPFFKSKYGDLSSVWAAIRELLSSNRLAVIQTMEGHDDGRQKLRTVLAHESGEWIDSMIAIRPTKDDPQQTGSAITYARRYSLAAIVGVAPEDHDGEDAMDRTTKTSNRPSSQQKSNGNDKHLIRNPMAGIYHQAQQGGISDDGWKLFLKETSITEDKNTWTPAQLACLRKKVIAKIAELDRGEESGPMFATEETLDILWKVLRSSKMASTEEEMITQVKFHLRIKELKSLENLTEDEAQRAIRLIDKHNGGKEDAQ